ncbi:MAG TPA: hypothetical protein VFE32_18345 [Puia sp.]|jgi:CTP synthase (UTP-ammonia lyase)|nr:hypothetical protein [Puia sp.]
MHPAKIAILGNYNENYQPHYVMDRVFTALGRHYSFLFEWIPTETLVYDAAEKLNAFHGVIAGSGPYKSKEGVINGIRCARTNNVPFLGTCSGFGYTVLEFGQSLFQLGTVTHLNEGIPLPPGETFLQPLNDCSVEYRSMCCKPEPGSLTDLVYDSAKTINETTHCSYGIHRDMITPFEKEGLVVSARDEQGEAKMMEYDRNDFFIIVLFLPQLNSAPDHPHPLFNAFFKAAETNNIAMSF